VIFVRGRVQPFHFRCIFESSIWVDCTSSVRSDRNGGRSGNCCHCNSKNDLKRENSSQISVSDLRGNHTLTHRSGSPFKPSSVSRSRFCQGLSTKLICKFQDHRSVVKICKSQFAGDLPYTTSPLLTTTRFIGKLNAKNLQKEMFHPSTCPLCVDTGSGLLKMSSSTRSQE